MPLDILLSNAGVDLVDGLQTHQTPDAASCQHRFKVGMAGNCHRPADSVEPFAVGPAGQHAADLFRQDPYTPGWPDSCTTKRPTTHIRTPACYEMSTQRSIA